MHFRAHTHFEGSLLVGICHYSMPVNRSRQFQLGLQFQFQIQHINSKELFQSFSKIFVFFVRFQNQ